MQPAMIGAARCCARQALHLPMKTPCRRTLTTQHTKLEKLIVDTIKAKGPMSVAEYQTICMTHPTLGYYSRHRDEGQNTLLGKGGDFVTSPEISQTFGELLAIWFISRWQAQGTMKRTRIVELGPGRGTLLSDMLRTFSKITQFSSTIERIDLIEKSEFLKKCQEQKLDEWRKKDQPLSVNWYDTLEDLVKETEQVENPEREFVIVVAHEFFDALPTHIFERHSGYWQEVVVGLKEAKHKGVKLPDERSRNFSDAETTTAPTSDDANSLAMNTDSSDNDTPFALGTTNNPTTASLFNTEVSNRYRNLGLPSGSRVEISLELHKTCHLITRLLRTRKNYRNPVHGAGLIIDYGNERYFQDSFRGFRNHEIVNPLTRPGETDITFNVDFAAVRETLRGMETVLYEPNTTPLVDIHGLITQRNFLTSMGLDVRVGALTKNKDETTKDRIQKAANRLVDQTQMGSQYKVMGFTSPSEPSTMRREDVYPFIE